MGEKNGSLASELVAEIQNEKNVITIELESMDSDFEKVLFTLNDALEDIGKMGIPETREESLIQHYNLQRVNMKLNIAYDYVLKLQNIVSDIVIKERRKDTIDREKQGGIEDEQ